MAQIRTEKKLFIGGALLITFLSFLVLTGWVTNLQLLKSLNTSLVTMKVNTALSFSFSAIAFLLLISGSGMVLFIRFLCAFVLFVALATLLEYLLAADFMIDNIIIPEKLNTVGTIYPGRMSPVTAGNFFLLGTGLMTLTTEWKYSAMVTQLLSLVVFFLSFTGLLGYLYGVQAGLNLSEVNNTALYSIIIFLIFSLLLFTSVQGKGLSNHLFSRYAGGMMFRKQVFPLLISFPLIAAVAFLGVVNGYYNEGYGVALIVLAQVVLFFIISYVNARSLNKMDKDKEAAKNKYFKQNQELNRINTDLDTFLYMASHDLKAPISNIEGLTSALKELCPPDNKDGKVIFDHLDESIRKFQETINEITTINKVQKNLVDDVYDLDLNAILDEVTHELEKLIKVNKPIISYNLQWQSIRFSKKNLRSIIYNLISNAIKYQDPERRSEINISTYYQDNRKVLKVSDNGRGIKAQYQDRVFEMYRRFDTGTEGTGLGLYMVKRIMENAEGTVALSSTEGKGSEFLLYFPLDED